MFHDFSLSNRLFWYHFSKKATRNVTNRGSYTVLLLKAETHTPEHPYVPWFCPFSFKTLRISHLLLYISGCLWPSDTWALKSVFSTPQPSFPILPVHASIAAPNLSSSFFQTEIVQAFTKTFPSLIYQDFINPTIILRVLRYPFAQTQVTPPASTLAALQIASFTCIPLHLKYLLFQK